MITHILRGPRLARAALGWLLAAVIALSGGRAAPAQEAAPDIGGVYVVGQKFILPTKIWKYGNGTLGPALRKPGVDGVLIDLDWSDIAPSYKKYDWSLLDYMARAAVGQDKKFEIAIITGGSTPAWVFAPAPAGYGAQSATFDYIQSTKPGALCAPQRLPVPWDARYHAALRDLLDRLARHLRDEGYYPNLTMLRITAIDTLTDELRLPGQTPQNTPNYTPANKCTVNNLALWQSLGYRPGLVREGWRQMLALYASTFPDKAFNVALITASGFPAFTAEGMPVTAPQRTVAALADRMTRELAKIGGRELPGQLVVQSNGLVGGEPPDPPTIADALKAHAGLAWQTNEWDGLAGGAACGGTRALPVACTAAGFAAMLTRGVYPDGTKGRSPLKARYLELFPANIAAFPHVVLHVHDMLLP